MCGIALYFSEDTNKKVDWMDNALKVMQYRGPDNCNQWKAKKHNLLLGHNRLAILDLSEAGNQPMHNRKGRYSIVFNGEIYNYKDLIFHLKQIHGVDCLNQNDTTVILEMYSIYKEKMLSHLEGMYSIAIWDDKEAEIFLARDLAGEKPLYYKSNNEELFVASELKPFFYGATCDIDVAACSSYFNNGYFGAQSVLRDVELIPPGQWLRFKGPKIVETGYQSQLNYNINRNKTSTFEARADHIENLIKNSLTLQMQSDVPNAFLLSGGLDSSLLVCMAKSIQNKINTFTVKMGASKLDESAYATYVSDFTCSNHLEVNVSNLNEEEILRILKLQDEPQADSSFIPTFKVYEAISKYFKVAIGGDGGDELFGGYEHYTLALNAQQRRAQLSAQPFQQGLKIIKKFMPYGLPGRNLLHRLDLNTDLVRSKMNYINEKELEKYSCYKAFKDEKNDIREDDNLLFAMRKYDFNNYLPNNILRKIDRASMLNSVESRSPFLNRDLIKYSFTNLDSEQLVSSSEKKLILKKIAKKYLPVNFNYNRKQGFQFPLNEYINTGKLDGIINDYVINNNIGFDRSYVRKLVQQNKLGFSNTEKIFAILSFSVWFEEIQRN
jgi:asparagine synthase (glutamine-hydrolysing)